MAFEKLSDNGLLLYGLHIFRFQISIHTLQLDLPKKVLPLEKISDNGLLLYGLDIYRFQISIHTFDVPKSTPVPENIRQWPLRKYQTSAFCYMV